MTRKRTTEQIAKGATTVFLDIALPCGSSVRVELVHTGLGSHVAVITAKNIHHDCKRCSALPSWELHFWKHMTPAKFKRYGYAQIDFTETEEEPCH